MSLANFASQRHRVVIANVCRPFRDSDLVDVAVKRAKLFANIFLINRVDVCDHKCCETIDQWWTDRLEVPSACCSVANAVLDRVASVRRVLDVNFKAEFDLGARGHLASKRDLFSHLNVRVGFNQLEAGFAGPRLRAVVEQGDLLDDQSLIGVQLETVRVLHVDDGVAKTLPFGSLASATFLGFLFD